jgi:hypothetical protein
MVPPAHNVPANTAPVKQGSMAIISAFREISKNNHNNQDQRHVRARIADKPPMPFQI